MPTESYNYIRPHTQLANAQPDGISVSGWLLLVLLLFTAFLFSPTLSNDFVNWDDDVNILENPHVQKLDGASIKAIFSTTIIGNYNPLPIFTFAIEKHFFGNNPFVFHFNNLWLHLLAIVLVYFVVKKIINASTNFRNREIHIGALFVATIFAIHPMHVESVAWITERKDLLFVVFYLAAMLAYFIYLEHKVRNRKYLLLIYIFFILSCLSKIQAVAFPLALLGIDVLKNGKFRWTDFYNKTPLFLIALITGGLGIYFLHQAGTIDQTGFAYLDRFFLGSYSLCIYLFKFIFPIHLSPLYAYPGELSISHYLSVLPFIGYLYLLYWSYKKQLGQLFFGLWFFITNIIFLLQFLGAGQAFLANRFSYLPYVGLGIVFYHTLQYFYQSTPKSKSLILGLPLLLMAFWSQQSFYQTQIWKNGHSLWSAVLDDYPQSDLALHNRGFWYQQQNDIQNALRDYNAAIKLDAKQAKYFNSRAKAYLTQNEWHKAIVDYNTAIQLEPLKADYYNNRATVYGAQSDFQSALLDLNQALTLQPDFADAYLNRALLYAHTQQFDKALDDNLKYLAFHPSDANIWTEAGMNARFSGQVLEAKEYITKALSINPKDKIALEEMAALTFH